MNLLSLLSSGSLLEVSYDVVDDEKMNVPAMLTLTVPSTGSADFFAIFTVGM